MEDYNMELPKTGKLPKKEDRRNIKLAKIFKKVLPPIPDKWDTDLQIPFGLPLEMWGNDVLGDCVEVTKFNWMLRAEATEQKRVVQFSLKDVKDNYFRETGGPDTGLIMLDSMKDWRSHGIEIGARKLLCIRRGGELYKTHGFAELEPGNANELRASVYLLGGVAAGFILPESVQQQWLNGETWEDVGDTNLWAGHAMAIKSYNEIGPKCLTWGKEVQLTWKFFHAWNDEGYACVDARNDPSSPIDEEMLEGLLKEITE
jgi:hypothetical protein